jgi:hypothetical protein
MVEFLLNSLPFSIDVGDFGLLDQWLGNSLVPPPGLLVKTELISGDHVYFYRGSTWWTRGMFSHTRKSERSLDIDGVDYYPDHYAFLHAQ